MGDRCYLTIHIHGTIETVEDFNAIAAAIEAEGMGPDDYSGHGAASIAQHMLASAAEGLPAGFCAEEVNYANIDDLESALREIGLPYHVSHDAGGSYPGGVWTWRPQAGKVEAISTGETGQVVSVEELRRALKAEDPLLLISEIVSDADAAGGAGLPPFALSDAVRQHFGLQDA